MTDAYTPVRACRACGSKELFDVLDLGEQPLANAFREPADTTTEARFPLGLVGCAECTLLQLAGTVEPRVLFSNYPYLSSTSSSFVAAAREVARRTIDAEGLGERSLVVEIGSNDGYLLRHYVEAGVNVLGVDPATKVADVARRAGVDTWTAFFDREVADKIRHERGPAAVVHANNVVAHVPDPNDVFGAIARVLDERGVALVESPHVLPLLDRCEFDTVYHEHVFYWSLTAMQQLVARHGLEVTDIDQLPVHGGSLRYHLRHRPARPKPGVERVRRQEQQRVLGTPDAYAAFVAGTRHVRDRLPEFLTELRRDGARVAAYGAAAKGTVLLNTCRLGPEIIEFVADKNTLKQGRTMPGVGIPIVRAEALVERQPDTVLLLAWNLAGEIREQEREYVAHGGRFVVPIPEPRFLDEERVRS